jgi:hypothetical protein
MKTSKIWTSFVCVAALLILASCTKVKPPDTGRLDKTEGVTISDCEPSKDPIKLPKGGIVKWTPQDADYVITFEPKSYPSTGKPITVPGPLSLPKGVTTSQTLDLAADCTSKKGCYYKYDITQVPDKIPCYDPGIHIVPN